MPNAVSWDQVTALDPGIVRQAVDFPVNVEPMLSKDNQLLSSRNMISILNDKKEIVKLGEVSVSRPLIKHTEAMDLVIRELDAVGTPYKLRQSVIDRKKFSLYQEFIFDHEIDVPDGEAISPMVTMHCDYTREAPFSVSIGTYRYVCTNGALVSGAGGMVTLRADAKNWDMMKSVGFTNDLRSSLDHFSSVSAFYQTLADMGYTSGLKKLLSTKELPIGFKKQMLLHLEENGEVTINIDTDKPNVEFRSKLIKAEDLEPSVFDSTVSITGDNSMWTAYNWATDYASHKTTTAFGMLQLNAHIDKAFHKMLA